MSRWAQNDWQIDFDKSLWKYELKNVELQFEFKNRQVLFC